MIQIIDNYLPPEKFEEARRRLMDYGFPWMWNDSVTKKEGEADESEFQFVHSFYQPLAGVVTAYPEYRQILGSYVDKMNPVSLMRIKANLNVATKEYIDRELHTDFDIDCTTAIAYINTNNGYTIFEDGSKVESIENRVVIFPSFMKHAGVPCTDEKRRVVINFNYLK